MRDRLHSRQVVELGGEKLAVHAVLAQQVQVHLALAHGHVPGLPVNKRVALSVSAAPEAYSVLLAPEVVLVPGRLDSLPVNLRQPVEPAVDDVVDQLGALGDQFIRGLHPVGRPERVQGLVQVGGATPPVEQLPDHARPRPALRDEQHGGDFLVRGVFPLFRRHLADLRLELLYEGLLVG